MSDSIKPKKPKILTDIAIKQAKPGLKTEYLPAGKGLRLAVEPHGGKWWRFDFRFAQKQKTISLGTYPEVRLASAIERRDEARRQIKNGVNPSEYRRAQKNTISGADSFEAVAREWHLKFRPNWSNEHAQRILRRLEQDVFPWIGAKTIGDIKSPEILQMIRRIEDRGALDTAHRALQNVGQVFRYAVAAGRAERDPSGDLKGAIPPVSQKHHASITDPKEVGELLGTLHGYTGSFITRSALLLAPLVFVRPGELRKAEWSEFDLVNAEWRIPAQKMKMKVVHIVPLSRQALAILNELHPLTGRGTYLFPGLRSAQRPMSENTVNAVLRRLGYSKEEMTGHGFRSMASTLLNEQGWNKDAIERQLAHSERNSVRAAYNYAEHLPERKRMMQAWADYLEAIKNGADIISFKRGKT